MYTIYIELWKCDLLKATTDDAPDGDRTGDPSTQSPMHYRLRQSAPLPLQWKTQKQSSAFRPQGQEHI